MDYSGNYPRVWWPDHPQATKDGLVKIHRAVACEREGRVIGPDEHVHHMDEDRNNWASENLKVLTPAEHNAIHPQFQGVIRECAQCGEDVRVPQSHAKWKNSFCDVKCSGLFQERAEWPSDEELKRWLWEKPMQEIGLTLGVGSNAIKKRCRKRGIEKPPTGYWLRKK